MRTSSPGRLRLRNPGDILAAVPYLMGFHPTDSVVVLGLCAWRLIFHARADLPPASTPAADLRTEADRLTGLFAEQGANQVILVGYGEPRLVTPTIMAVRAAMRRRRVVVVEALRATGGRYWSYECRQACCPADGTPFEVAGTAVAAAATVAGCVALPDRAAVVHSLAAPAGAGAVDARVASERAAARLAQARARRPRSAVVAEGRAVVRAALARYSGDGRLGDDEIAWLCTLVGRSLEVRDFAWRLIDRSPHDRRPHERLWSDVVRRCEPTLVPGPAVLLAYTQWRLGDGVRASIALDRALAADPRYPAALLLGELLRRAIPPSAMAGLVSAPRRGRPARRRAQRRRTR